MTDWIDALYRELDQWNYDGVEATFWWRDDDAQTPTPELDQLLALARRYDAPLALAVIPAGLDRALATRLESSAVAVLQHGFAHANHAARGEKKMELGDERDIEIVQRELSDGLRVLRDAFAARFIAVLTPPWNRIAPSLPPMLAQHGYRGLSTFAPRAAGEAAPGLRVVNTHVDVIDWKRASVRGARPFVGAHRATEAMVAHLRGRRCGAFDSAEPTGLLTHHLVHDNACWRFLSQLLAALDDHPAVKFISAAMAFAIDFESDSVSERD
ncbi:MAG: polysaccharide deacetylase family protein [bacterium]